MDKPMWVLKDAHGQDVWHSNEPDYVRLLEQALKEVGYELVWSDLQKCPGCGYWNAICICQPVE